MLFVMAKAEGEPLYAHSPARAFSTRTYKVSYWMHDIPSSCADPDSFVRGGPTLLYDSGPSCWPNIDFLLGSFLIFQGIRTSMAKKPKLFL